MVELQSDRSSTVDNVDSEDIGTTPVASNAIWQHLNARARVSSIIRARANLTVGEYNKLLCDARKANSHGDSPVTSAVTL